MEGNKDEGSRCLRISQKHLEAGNLPSARKFCIKAIALFDTPEAQKLLERIDDMISSSSSTSTETSGSANSQTETHPSAEGLKHRHTVPKASNNGTAGGMGGEKRDFTPEQLAVVKRVKACKVTEYYEILAVKKDCEDVEVKKAYRKVCYFLLLDISPSNVFCFSLLWLYTPIRMVLRVQTRPSRVSYVSCITSHISDSLSIVVSKAFQVLSGLFDKPVHSNLVSESTSKTLKNAGYMTAAEEIPKAALEAAVQAQASLLEGSTVLSLEKKSTPKKFSTCSSVMAVLLSGMALEAVDQVSWLHRAQATSI